jgi:NADH-quinone oxidoreductase subunit L
MTAGIAIHALTGEQDIRKMGGLGKAMPHTKRAFLIGSLALVGLPPFAGFFSKDSIISATLDRGTFGYCLFLACIVGAVLTGIYTFRLYFIVFGGEKSAFAQEHLHTSEGKLEGPLSMVWTVTVLAVLAVVGGFLQFGQLWHPLSTWLAPVAAPIADASNKQEFIGSVCAVLAGACGMYIAYAMYSARSMKVPKPVKLFEKKFYWDELYDAIFYKTGDLLANGLGRFVERPVIAGSITEITRGFRLGSGGLGRVQNGLVRSYALALASGVAVLAIVFVATR